MILSEVLMCSPIRNFIVLSTLCLCFISDSYSQDTALLRYSGRHPRPFFSKLEILAGPSIVYGWGEYLEDNRVIKFNYSAGIGLIHRMNSNFRINAKLLYEGKGIKTISYSPFTDSPPTTLKLIEDVVLKYATFSLLTRYDFHKTEIYFGAGPYLGYLLREKLSQTTYLEGELFQRYVGRYKTKNIKDFKEFDFGLMIMLGYDFRINKSTMASIQLAFNSGLIDVNVPTVTGFRNNTFSLLVGINLDKK